MADQDPNKPHQSEAPKVAGVPVDHPRITEFVRNCAKDGRSKADAVKLSGMPGEVVDKIYHQYRSEK